MCSKTRSTSDDVLRLGFIVSTLIAYNLTCFSGGGGTIIEGIAYQSLNVSG